MPRTIKLNDYQQALRGEQEASGDPSQPHEDDDGAAARKARGFGTATTDAVMQAARPPVADNRAVPRETQDQNYDVLAGTRSDENAEGGSRVYSVDSGGSVSDWRRPDPGLTPDRGPEVGTTVHAVAADDQRFSGAGSDAPARALVPTDAQFVGRQYREAPELADIAERLVDTHGFLAELANCDIRWYWKRKTGSSKGRVKIGFMKRASDLLGHFSGADFIGWLSATTARDSKFTSKQVEAAVLHQLCHVGADDNGNWVFVPHDFEGFAQEVRHYGTWTESLKLGGSAFTAASQMGLFDETDDDEEGEDASPGAEYTTRAQWPHERHAPMRDGAGVLVHADGTALTDDEIEAIHRHELADDDLIERDSADDVAAFDADQPADPDQPYDDELDDLPTDAEIDAALSDRDL